MLLLLRGDGWFNSKLIYFCFQSNWVGEGFIISRIYGGVVFLFFGFFFPDSRVQGLMFPGNEVLLPHVPQQVQEGEKGLFPQSFSEFSSFSVWSDFILYFVLHFDSTIRKKPG